MEVKYGNQEPRIRFEQPYSSTDGEDAGLLAETYGLKPDPWQQMLLTAGLSRKGGDKLVLVHCGLCVPRHHGK